MPSLPIDIDRIPVLARGCAVLGGGGGGDPMIGALMALFSGLVALLGILLSVLPLLLVIAAIAGGVYLIVH